MPSPRFAMSPRPLIQVALLCALAVRCGTPSAAARSEEAGPGFDVKITSVAGGAGATLNYHLTADELVVTGATDHGDHHEPKELLRVQLDQKQSDDLREFMGTFPLKRLRRNYVRIGGNDAREMTFEISIAGTEAKRIEVVNRKQKDLARLCRRVNALIGEEKYRVPVPD